MHCISVKYSALQFFEVQCTADLLRTVSFISMKYSALKICEGISRYVKYSTLHIRGVQCTGVQKVQCTSDAGSTVACSSVVGPH